MKTGYTTPCLAITIAVLALGASFYYYAENHKSSTALQTSQAERQALQVKIETLESLLISTNHKQQAAEHTIAALRLDLKTASTNQPASADINVPITKDYVESRYKQARAFAKCGNHTEAAMNFSSINRTLNDTPATSLKSSRPTTTRRKPRPRCKPPPSKLAVPTYSPIHPHADLRW